LRFNSNFEAYVKRDGREVKTKGIIFPTEFRVRSRSTMCMHNGSDPSPHLAKGSKLRKGEGGEKKARKKMELL
jgi:hypothetical protein